MDASVPLYSETHAGEEVAIYARGPMAHLFHGAHEQSYIAHVMAYAMCIGPRQDLCDAPEPGAAQMHAGNSSLVLILAAVALVVAFVRNK